MCFSVYTNRTTKLHCFGTEQSCFFQPEQVTYQKQTKKKLFGVTDRVVKGNEVLTIYKAVIHT